MGEGNGTLESIARLKPEEFVQSINKLPLPDQLKVMKIRCELGDDRACKVYDRELHGNPDAPDEAHRLGLIDMWYVNRDAQAGQILQHLGEI